MLYFVFVLRWYPFNKSKTTENEKTKGGVVHIICAAPSLFVNFPIHLIIAIIIIKRRKGLPVIFKVVC
jgi:lipopolysaccharide/colanic/teichoic acid biosynthesis glycosyltransferase